MFTGRSPGARGPDQPVFATGATYAIFLRAFICATLPFLGPEITSLHFLKNGIFPLAQLAIAKDRNGYEEGSLFQGGYMPRAVAARSLDFYKKI